jgi:hypothetical protein
VCDDPFATWRQPDGDFFEFPTSALDDPAYLYYSTFHRQSLINGYSGFFPYRTCGLGEGFRTS